LGHAVFFLFYCLQETVFSKKGESSCKVNEMRYFWPFGDISRTISLLFVSFVDALYTK
jgi:hypothetical protein